MRRSFLVVAALLVIASVARSADDPLTKLKDYTLAYFKPVSGKITKVAGTEVTLSIGEKEGLRKGMRLKVLREGAPFVHPVTKEPLGTVETTVGKVEVRDVAEDTAAGAVVEGEVREGDKVRIAETKVRVLFVQDRSIDWYLADDYYRKLKASGRIELVDTDIETADEATVTAEAKRLTAEAALVLTGRAADKETTVREATVRERLFWASDGAKFIDTETQVDINYVRDLKFGQEFFTPKAGEAALMYDLPFGARFVAAGDVDGDGTQEVILSTGKDIRIYSAGADLKLLWEIKGSGRDNHIWLDTIDLNNDRKDEIVVTSMRGDEIISSIYALEGSGFRKVWETKNFLRRLGNGLIGQAYSPSDGYSGDVFSVTWSQEYRIGEKIPLPKGVNIYDFALIEGPSKENLVFAYDETGFLNLYDERGLRLWRSSKGTGGFLTTFNKPTPIVFLGGGQWSVKDRLSQRQRDVLAITRTPLAEMAKTLGYKSSTLKDYWWTGATMEETVLVDGIKGSLLDYAFTGDRVIALTSPMLGLKFSNILKGESPLGTMLYIYSLKGR